MATLPALPTEILSVIAQHLASWNICYHDHGLCALRSTCRMIHSKTQYDFYKIAFSTIELDFQPKSLECFLHMCKSDAFGRAVRRVVLVQGGDERVYFPKIQELQGSNLKEQVTTVLRDIFLDGFKCLKNVTEIVIIAPFVARFWQHRSSSLAIQHSITYHSTGDQENSQTMCSPITNNYNIIQCTIFTSHLYDILMEAITAANIQPQKLEITQATLPSKGEYLQGFSISLHSFYKWRTALKRLKDLKIILDISEGVTMVSSSIRDDDATDYRFDSKSDPLYCTLASIPELTTLSLQFVKPTPWAIDENGHYHQPIRALTNLKLPCLSQLSILNARTETTHLIQFLYNHKDTLTRLNLVSVMLLEGRWRELLNSLLAHHVHRLYYLELSDLNQDSQRLHAPRYSVVIRDGMCVSDNLQRILERI